MCEHLGEHREIVNDDDVNDLTGPCRSKGKVVKVLHY